MSVLGFALFAVMLMPFPGLGRAPALGFAHSAGLESFGILVVGMLAAAGWVWASARLVGRSKWVDRQVEKAGKSNIGSRAKGARSSFHVPIVAALPVVPAVGMWLAFALGQLWELEQAVVIRLVAFGSAITFPMYALVTSEFGLVGLAVLAITLGIAGFLFERLLANPKPVLQPQS